MPSLPLKHPRQQLVREGDRRTQVDRERPVHLLDGEVLEASGRRKRRVRDEDVDLAGFGEEAHQVVAVR